MYDTNSKSTRQLQKASKSGQWRLWDTDEPIKTTSWSVSAETSYTRLVEKNKTAIYIWSERLKSYKDLETKWARRHKITQV